MNRSTSKPLIVFDGDCDFCRRWIERWRTWTGDRVDYAPYQEAADRFPEIPVERFHEAVVLIAPDGRVCCGAEAVCSLLAHTPMGRSATWSYHHIPWLGPVAERVYRFVAGHRRLFSVLTTLLWGRDVRPSSFRLSACLFLRLFGVVCLLAFGSLWTQIGGLIGSGGILPVADLMARVQQQGDLGFWQFPTLCWLGSGDGFLHGLCAVGVLASGLLVVGVAPVVALGVIWCVYLSLAVAGQAFMGFQWDVLLIETALVTLFYAPLGLVEWRCVDRAPRALGRWLIWALLFKLMFLSGVTKLLSGDPSWRGLGALSVHYETQPIPNAVSWYAHQLPLGCHQAGVVGMFMVELAVPFLIFAPRRLRHVGAAALILLQLLIALTGNYGFFNLLSAVLCVTCFDDRLLERWTPTRWRAWVRPVGSAPLRWRWPQWLAVCVGGILLVASVLTTVRELVRSQNAQSLPTPVVWFLSGCDRYLLSWAGPCVLDWTGPFRSVNGYGLFRVMTTQRPEIIVEGSRDGRLWQPYAFAWKPGQLKRRPPFVAPHQPRLDWQMWFAALNPRANAYWLERFMQRLLEGSPSVLALLEDNPFPDAPPRYLRLVYYRYRFTDAATRHETGAWWRRYHKGVLTQPVSLVR